MRLGSGTGKIHPNGYIAPLRSKAIALDSAGVCHDWESYSPRSRRGQDTGWNSRLLESLRPATTVSEAKETRDNSAGSKPPNPHSARGEVLGNRGTRPIKLLGSLPNFRLNKAGSDPCVWKGSNEGGFWSRNLENHLTWKPSSGELRHGGSKQRERAKGVELLACVAWRIASGFGVVEISVVPRLHGKKVRVGHCRGADARGLQGKGLERNVYGFRGAPFPSCVAKRVK